MINKLLFRLIALVLALAMATSNLALASTSESALAPWLAAKSQAGEPFRNKWMVIEDVVYPIADMLRILQSPDSKHRIEDPKNILIPKIKVNISNRGESGKSILELCDIDNLEEVRKDKAISGFILPIRQNGKIVSRVIFDLNEGDWYIPFGENVKVWGRVVQDQPSAFSSQLSVKEEAPSLRGPEGAEALSHSSLRSSGSGQAIPALPIASQPGNSNQVRDYDIQTIKHDIGGRAANIRLFFSRRYNEGASRSESFREAQEVFMGAYDGIYDALEGDAPDDIKIEAFRTAMHAFRQKITDDIISIIAREIKEEDAIYLRNEIDICDIFFESFVGQDPVKQVDLKRLMELVQVITLEGYDSYYSLILDIADDAKYIAAREGRLFRVLLNLVRNSVEAMERGRDALGDEARFKYEGSIDVNTRREGGEVVISISDTGPGMTAEQIEKFRKGVSFSSKAFGGGRGLPTVKYLVEQDLGGTIDVESEVGKGTMFIIRLPIAGRPSDKDMFNTIPVVIRQESPSKESHRISVDVTSADDIRFDISGENIGDDMADLIKETASYLNKYNSGLIKQYGPSEEIEVIITPETREPPSGGRVIAEYGYDGPKKVIKLHSIFSEMCSGTIIERRFLASCLYDIFSRSLFDLGEDEAAHNILKFFKVERNHFEAVRALLKEQESKFIPASGWPDKLEQESVIRLSGGDIRTITHENGDSLITSRGGNLPISLVNMKTIIVFPNFVTIGDTLLHLGALRAIREEIPDDCRIIWVTRDGAHVKIIEQANRENYSNFHEGKCLVDEIITFPGIVTELSEEEQRKVIEMVDRSCRDRGDSIAFLFNDLHREKRIGMCRAAGVKYIVCEGLRIAEPLETDIEPTHVAYIKAKIDPEPGYPKEHGQSYVMAWHTALFSVFAEYQKILQGKAFFPVFQIDTEDGDCRAVDKFFIDKGLDSSRNSIFVVHPGAYSGTDYEFSGLIAKMVTLRGAKVVVTQGREPRDARAIKALKNILSGLGIKEDEHVFYLSPVSLNGLAACLRKAHLFILRDTGPSHLAGSVDLYGGLAVYTPTIVLYDNKRKVERWAPRHPFTFPVYPAGEDGIANIKEDQIMDVINTLYPVELDLGAISTQQYQALLNTADIFGVSKNDLEKFFLPIISNVLKQLSEREKVVMAVSGPMGSGKTTTAALIKEFINSILPGRPSAEVLNQDDFFDYDKGKLAGLEKPNFTEVDKIMTCIDRFMQGESMTHPVREARSGGWVRSKKMAEKYAERVLIIEGVYLFIGESARFPAYGELFKRFDLKVWVDAGIEWLTEWVKDRDESVINVDRSKNQDLFRKWIPASRRHWVKADYIIIKDKDHRIKSAVWWNREMARQLLFQNDSSGRPAGPSVANQGQDKPIVKGQEYQKSSLRARPDLSVEAKGKSTLAKVEGTNEALSHSSLRSSGSGQAIPALPIASQPGNSNQVRNVEKPSLRGALPPKVAGDEAISGSSFVKEESGATETINDKPLTMNENELREFMVNGRPEVKRLDADEAHRRARQFDGIVRAHNRMLVSGMFGTERIVAEDAIMEEVIQYSADGMSLIYFRNFINPSTGEFMFLNEGNEMVGYGSAGRGGQGWSEVKMGLHIFEEYRRSGLGHAALRLAMHALYRMPDFHAPERIIFRGAKTLREDIAQELIESNAGRFLLDRGFHPLDGQGDISTTDMVFQVNPSAAGMTRWPLNPEGLGPVNPYDNELNVTRDFGTLDRRSGNDISAQIERFLSDHPGEKARVAVIGVGRGLEAFELMKRYGDRIEVTAVSKEDLLYRKPEKLLSGYNRRTGKITLAEAEDMLNRLRQNYFKCDFDNDEGLSGRYDFVIFGAAVASYIQSKIPAVIDALDHTAADGYVYCDLAGASFREGEGVPDIGANEFFPRLGDPAIKVLDNSIVRFANGSVTTLSHMEEVERYEPYAHSELPLAKTVYRYEHKTAASSFGKKEESIITNYEIRTTNDARAEATHFADNMNFIDSRAHTPPTIVAIGTKWMKGYERGEDGKFKHLQGPELNKLITDIETTYANRKHVAVVVGDDKDLPGLIETERGKKNMAGARVVMLADINDIMPPDKNGEVSKEFKPLVEDRKNVVIGVDGKELEEDSYVRLMEMLTIALKLSLDIAPSLQNDHMTILPPDKTHPIYIIVPHAEPMNYELLKVIYEVQRYA